MNLQDSSIICEKKFLEIAKEKLGESVELPTFEITKFCRMLSMYCDSKAEVSKSFMTAMTECTNKIKAVVGLEEILDIMNECPEE